MCALVTRFHFRSRDKDGDNTTQYAIAENLMLRETSWLYVYVMKLQYCKDIL